MSLNTFKLPKWYPLQKIKGRITVEELIELGKRKIDLLLEISRRSSEDNFLQYTEDNFVEVVGGLALRLAVALSEDRFFKSWLLENEGDLFVIRFKNCSFNEKLLILKDLFGDILIGWGEITGYFNLSKDTIWQEFFYLVKDYYAKSRKDTSHLISSFLNNDLGVVAVRFWSAPRLLKRKRGILVNGWIITWTDFLFREAKWKFQKKLEEHIIKLISEKKSGSERLLSLEDAIKEIIDYWRKKRDVVAPRVSISIKGEKLYERDDLWPLCMRILLSRLSTTGYLQHGERLQLGLFLKRLGMSLEEQLQFWYKFAVDNVGMSWDEFEKKGGYYIRHIYGVVGSRKDYEAPKCDTIISKYFCPFKTLQTEQLKEIISSLYPGFDEKVIKEILHLARIGEPKKACLKLLSSLVNKKLKMEEILHPLQFVRIVYSFEKRRKKNEENKSSTNAK